MENKEFRCRETKIGLITGNLVFLKGKTYKGRITRNGNYIIDNEDNNPTFWFPNRLNLFFKLLKPFRYGK